MKNDKNKIKRGDLVRVTPYGKAIGKVLNVSSDVLGNPIASIIFSDNDRVEVMSLKWLELFRAGSVWDIIDCSNKEVNHG
jgi:hypothetical protein